MAYMLEILQLTLFVAWTFAQAPQNPVTDFCRRYGQQTAVIDRNLYIDGGWVYANPLLQNPIPTINQNLLYSNLDVTNQGMPVQSASLSKNNTVPSVSGGILWSDDVNKVFWLYGGEFATAPSSFQLWGYDVILNQWNLSSASTSSTLPIQRVSYGAGTTLAGRGYYYGGYLNNLTNPLWNGDAYATSDLIILDMDANTLTNSSGPDNNGRAEGVMLSIPASAAGLLIYFGGVYYPYGNSTAVPMSMSEITVYDVADAKWYLQTTTGDIPANRRMFCAGATWAGDQSSYNIYLYGGFGFGENATGFDDVYILSMPTFEWIKWYPTTPGSIPAPHGGMTCNVIDRSQMIVMGGNFTNSTACDVPIVGGQHNLNLGQDDFLDEKWYQFLPNVTNYTVPQAIYSITGGNLDGGATNQSPKNGWSNSALSVYFAQKASFPARTPTRYIPLSTGGSSSGDKPSIGAIVGGAVGGFVVLLIIAVTIWWFCRRRRPRSDSPDQIAQVSEAPKHFQELGNDQQRRPNHQERQSAVTELTGEHSQHHHHSKLAMATTSPSTPRYFSPDPSYASYDHPPLITPGQPMTYHSALHSPQELYALQQQGYIYPQYHSISSGDSPPPPGLYQQFYTPTSGSDGSPHGTLPQQQQYFPRPEMNRTSPPVPQEMPTSRTPGVHQVIYQPIAQRPDIMGSVSSRSQEERSNLRE